MTKMTMIAGLCALMLATVAQAQDFSSNSRNDAPGDRVGVEEDPGATRDYNCGGKNMSPCDDDFAKGCEDGGGVMSGQQRWGGKTCFNAFVHEDPNKDT
ncbi:MAG: hypothetical protein AAFR93_06450 [Pseudomonadota bacterium]